MLIGGAVTDRVSPRRIMILTAVARTLLVAALAGFVWTQHVQIWQIYALCFGFGVADAFAAPAAQTFLPSLVAPAQLPAGKCAIAGHAANCHAGHACTRRHLHCGLWHRIGTFH